MLSPGALLLVVDSPGSYSTVSIGKTSDSGDESKKKRYPMQWLLDHTLLESAAISNSKNASGEHQWEKLESRNSEWFRLSDDLRYPVDLEDMRYQIHLYRRL
jgi:25S rRNA (uracil2843-N3)-methyltransferase